MSTEHHGLIMPSSPEDRKRLKAAIDEMVGCLTSIAAQRDHMGDIVSLMSEEFDLPKKLINKAAKIQFKEDYQKVAAENEDLDTLLETLKMVNVPIEDQLNDLLEQSKDINVHS